MKSSFSRRSAMIATPAVLMFGATAAPAAAVTPAVALAAARKRPNTLAFAAAGSGRLFGNSMSSIELGDTSYLAAMAAQCSLVSCGNALKADTYRRSPDGFDFAPADDVFEYLNGHQMAFHGHTLCWYRTVPTWVPETLTTKQQAEAELYLEVHEPCSHFAGQVQSWDVVNEVILPEDEQPLSLRKNYWQQMIGPDYIDLAFHTARQADPHALLCLNEADIEYDHPWFERKRQAVLSLLKRLRSNNVPIDAVGIECHLQYVDIGKFPFSRAVFQNFISDIAGLGLKVMITELDVPDRRLPADIAQRDAIVARATGDVVSAAVDHPAVVAIISYCLTDRYSWMTHDPNFARLDGLPSRGGLLDAQLAPKPAYWAVMSALENARSQAILF